MKKVHTFNSSYFLLFITIAFFTSSCSNKNLPEKTKNQEKETTLFRFPATKIFAKIPPGYIWDSEWQGFYFGDKKNILICRYFPEDGWSPGSFRIPGMKSHRDTIDGKPVEWIEGYVASEKKQSYMLVMKTDYYPVILTAQIQDTSLIDAMDVPGIFASLRHDESYDLDIFESESYSFDEEITGFKYYMNTGTRNSTTYLRDRIQNLDKLGPERIGVYGKGKLTEEEIDSALLRESENNPYKIISIVRTDTILNQRSISYTEMDYSFKEEPSYQLYAIIRGTEIDFVLKARTNRDLEEMKKKFWKTLESFKIKSAD